MATTTVPLCTPTVQPTRRTLLGALAAAPLAAAPAMAMPTAEADPHVGWLAEHRTLIEFWDGPDGAELDSHTHPVWARIEELEQLIVDTPATSPPGMLAQAEVGLVNCSHDGLAEGVAGKNEAVPARALRNLRATLKGLTGAGAVA